jgi:hypothetical protein
VENPFNIHEFDFRPHFQGFQATATFENGFGVSVVPEVDQKHYEVAVLRDGKLCYDSGLTSDVLRYLTVDEVHAVIFKARNLKEGIRVSA